jgi:hypothetical protein
MTLSEECYIEHARRLGRPPVTCAYCGAPATCESLGYPACDYCYALAVDPDDCLDWDNAVVILTWDA